MAGDLMTGCVSEAVQTPSGEVFVQRGGSGPAVLLLHGFPETSRMWHSIAPLLATNFTIVAADLPGYGRSGYPPDEPGHAAMSKRSLARTFVAVMRELGQETFAVIGHDRGARVAYRAALDHPEVVEAVAVLDIVPTGEVWDRADARLALAFWPFSLLAQAAPLPEQLIAGSPEAVVDNALSQWGSSPTTFPDWLREDYVETLRDPNRVHAICEEYRAAATIDREHDRLDREAGRRIACPLLCLWSEEGAVGQWYKDDGGPLKLWRTLATNVSGQAMCGGHFFPEEHPRETARLLREFLNGALAAVFA